ncbi:MAG: GxxExxY protein [Gammaproteobacteria bacterium]|nr:GxxExxY protein [Gammaproteobacteria bacterium]
MEPSHELDALARKTIGAAIEVHRALGPGYLESVYVEVLAIELTLRRLRFRRQPEISVLYKEHEVGTGRLDFPIDQRLVVALKAVNALNEIHQAQVISYLRATGLNLGLLINFNVGVLKQGIKRVVLS